MKFIQKVSSWGDAHHPKMLDLIRMLLGIFLVLKGYLFLRNYAYLRDLIIETRTIQQPSEMITFLIMYITYVHLVGGILIFLGLMTRLAALLQLPVVFAAVFYVNILSSFMNAELWLSVLVMALLILYTIIGSGPISFDYFLRRDSGSD